MKIIVVTESKSVPGEESVIRAALRAGVHRIHIRKPDWSEADLLQFITHFDGNEKKLLSVHSHHAAALAAGIGGIHFTYRQSQQERELLIDRANSQGALSSASCHTLDELQLQPAKDYLFLSPVFDSVSKSLEAAFDYSLLRNRLTTVTTPVFALGGVTPANLLKIAPLGFSGAASLGFIWQAVQPLQQVTRLLEEAAHA